jgi:nucleotide-binding universal stress UspA family protein
MSFKTIIVHVDDDQQAASRIKFATALAKSHGARLIGLAAFTIPPPTVGAAGFAVTVPIGEELSESVSTRLREFEAQFRALSAPAGEVEWRSAIDIPTSFLAESGRAADLVIAGSPDAAESASTFRRVDLGDLIMRVGRPVLVPAAGAEQLDAGIVVVAWRDSREARRAVRDALPFLEKARDVIVATVDDRTAATIRESLDDVVAFLSRHGIDAQAQVLSGGVSEALVDLALKAGAGLIVSGGYGHSRLREWAFGGVTRTLLGHDSISRLLSN